MEKDIINHPTHYTSGGIETIDIIETKFGAEGLKGFCLGNAMKYLCRAGKKENNSTLQDLKKCVWYLNRVIETLEANDEAN